MAGGKAKEFVAVVTIADAMAMVFPHEQSKLVALRLLVSPVYSACCILAAEKQSRCDEGLYAQADFNVMNKHFQLENSFMSVIPFGLKVLYY